MGFKVIAKSGKEDKVRTNRLKRQLLKSCDKITSVIAEEVEKFREAAKKEDLDDAFWMHSAHRAMLYISQKNKDSFLAAELGDLFAMEDVGSTEKFNTHVDIERLTKMKEKEEKKIKDRESKNK